MLLVDLVLLTQENVRGVLVQHQGCLGNGAAVPFVRHMYLRRSFRCVTHHAYFLDSSRLQLVFIPVVFQVFSRDMRELRGHVWLVMNRLHHWLGKVVRPDFGLRIEVVRNRKVRRWRHLTLKLFLRLLAS